MSARDPIDDRPVWTTPIIAEVPHDSPEFWEILASLSPEDRAVVKSPNIGAHLGGVGGMPCSELHVDQHGRPITTNNLVGNDVVLRHWKRPKREIFIEVAKHCYPPDGKPPENLTRGQVAQAMCRKARELGFDADLESDESTILRAVGRKRG
jgi:hypothetical protein